MSDWISPPPLARTLREVTALPREAVRLAWHWNRMADGDAGQGRPVMLLPGHMADDSSLIALGAYLRRRGYDAQTWGLGCNNGEVPRLLGLLLARLEGECDRLGRAPALVGWSLGGYLAREAARERPDLVEQIVTIGSPIVGGPKYTAFAGLMKARGRDIDAIAHYVESRNAVPLEVPVTAIFSRRDGIVAWQACLDTHNQQVDHVEVEARHLGLGLAPEVLELVAARLARPAGGGPIN